MRNYMVEGGDDYRVQAAAENDEDAIKRALDVANAVGPVRLWRELGRAVPGDRAGASFLKGSEWDDETTS